MKRGSSFPKAICMKRLLILDGSIHRGSYDPTEGWRRFLGGVESLSVHLPSGEKPPRLDDFTHLILTGSEATITKWEPWYELEAGCVREALEKGKAVLGSCFGHQMLALALSGEAHVGASPTPEIGWIEVEIQAEDSLLEGIPRRFWSFAFHFDEVKDPPPPWRILAKSAGARVQVMRYGDLPIWGLQAHPEIPPGDARPLLEAGLDLYPGKASLLRAALAQEPRDDGAIRKITKNFLEQGPEG